ncbi:uncharacterized protein JN550_012151 [Neofusicoccum parvum]|uniref:Uncharacterized protein JN550_012151 n=1 Tax=Neofusicoccum parvum TaxID=310453 RepID=A0ACB5SB21_9PEZI|nr:uncharacterized protein JN550_012151 [Neofusicoccum parvum]
MIPAAPLRLSAAALRAPLPRRHISFSQPRLRINREPFSFTFSTHRALLEKSPSSPNKRRDDKASSGTPEYPSFSFEALGISKNMRIGVIVVLSIFGTIETWFWCQWAWRWWKGGDGGNGEEVQ